MWMSAVGSMTLFSLRVIELGGDTRLVGIGWADVGAVRDARS